MRQDAVGVGHCFEWNTAYGLGSVVLHTKHLY